MFFPFVTKHACDRQTDKQTDRRMDGHNYDPQDRSSIAVSRGKKNVAFCGPILSLAINQLRAQHKTSTSSEHTIIDKQNFVKIFLPTCATFSIKTLFSFSVKRYCTSYKPTGRVNISGFLCQRCRCRRFGAVGSDVGQINEVTLRRARLVLGWLTVSGFNSR